MQRANKEVAKFYSSKRWQKIRKAYKIYRHGICERCGQPRRNRTPQKLYKHQQHIRAEHNNELR